MLYILHIILGGAFGLLFSSLRALATSFGSQLANVKDIDDVIMSAARSFLLHSIFEVLTTFEEYYCVKPNP